MKKKNKQKNLSLDKNIKIKKKKSKKKNKKMMNPRSLITKIQERQLIKRHVSGENNKKKYIFNLEELSQNKKKDKIKT